MRHLLLFGLAVALSSPSAQAQQAKDKANGPLLKIEDKLTADDPLDKVVKKGPHKVHEFKMKAGAIHIIDLSSKNFDAVLRLEDSAQKQLDINDDAGPETLNSRLLFQAAKDDTYRLIATTLDGKPGTYQLTVRAFPQPAPDLVGEFALNGKLTKLSELKGKVVLVDFWAVWCGPCIRTFPHLREWQKEHGDKGFEVLGVTTYYQRFGFDKENGRLKQVGKIEKDEKTGAFKVVGGLEPMAEHDMVKDFADHHKLSYRLMLISRPNWKKAGEDYVVGGIPHVALIDRQGNVRMVRVGANPENAEALAEEIKKLVAEK